MKSMLLYALPMMAVNILQYFFGAANITVLGILIRDVDRANASVAAIGATTTLTALALAFATGLSVGTNVLVARLVGERAEEKAQRTVGAAAFLGIVSGVLFGGAGAALSRKLLEWTSCDPSVIDKATAYLRIYFLGFPFITLYNVLSAVQRSAGDTVRPSAYLAAAIALNIALAVFFTAALHSDVKGAAISVVISQAVAAVLSFVRLLKTSGCSKLKIRYVRAAKTECAELLKTALPVVIHTSLFALSNVIVQSAVNGFGEKYMAGYAIAVQIDNVIYQAMAAVTIAALSFVSVSYGERNAAGVRKATRVSLYLICIIGGTAVLFIFTAGRAVCGVLSKDEEVVNAAMKRLTILGLPYTLCGIAEAFANVLRGMGKSALSMAIGIVGNCGARILLLKTVCRKYATFEALLFVFPVTWALTIVVYVAAYFLILKRSAAFREETERDKTAEKENQL